MKSFFITGTDTDVGKSHVACALIAAFATLGKRAAPMKPIAAGTVCVDGVEMNADVVALRAVSGSTAALSDINPYCFSQAMAPHIAAQSENVVVEMDVIRAAFDRLKAASDTVVVEGAGGFLVPMSARQSMAEVPTALGLEVILVAGMRLGVLNHALLTVEAIRSRGLTLAGWVANTMTATPMPAFDENLATLARMIAAPLLGTMPFDAQSKNSLERARHAAACLRIDTLLHLATPE